MAINRWAILVICLWKQFNNSMLSPLSTNLMKISMMLWQLLLDSFTIFLCFMVWEIKIASNKLVLTVLHSSSEARLHTIPPPLEGAPVFLFIVTMSRNYELLNSNSVALFPIHYSCHCGVTLRHSEQEVMIWFAAYCENLLIWMDPSEILLDEQKNNRCLYQCSFPLLSIGLSKKAIF